MLSFATIQPLPFTTEFNHSEYFRPYACPFPGCLQRFKRKYTLKDHMNAHMGVKPFVCPVSSCRKTFTTSGNLARHKRLHPWLDVPLPCVVEGCQCVFPTEAKLHRHIQSHFKASSARCDFSACGRVFSTPGNLRRHWKQHHAWPYHDSLAVMQTTVMAAPFHADSPHERLHASDHELLEVLECLFDDTEADPTPTPSYQSKLWSTTI